jgi:hypothetical protein
MVNWMIYAYKEATIPNLSFLICYRSSWILNEIKNSRWKLLSQDSYKFLQTFFKMQSSHITTSSDSLSQKSNSIVTMRQVLSTVLTVCFLVDIWVVYCLWSEWNSVCEKEIRKYLIGSLILGFPRKKILLFADLNFWAIFQTTF